MEENRKKYFLQTSIIRPGNVEIDESGKKIIINETQQYKTAPKKEAEDFGTATFIFYIVCFFIIYFTAFANCDKSRIFKNWGTDSKGFTHPAYNRCSETIGVGKDRSITLSYMLLFCNQYLSSPLILISCVLMAVMFLKQNFGVTGENDGRIFCVVGPFILGFLLSSLILFGPTKHSDVHFATAGLIILMGTLFCGISYKLYTQVYVEPEPEIKNQHNNIGTFDDLKHILILIVTTAVIAFVGAGFMWYLKHNKNVKNFELKVSITDKVLGFTELLNLILIGIYMLQVSKKPPLLVNNFCIASI